MIKGSRESGTAADKERPGRPRTAQCEDGIQRVAIDDQENPQTSKRVRFAQLGLSTVSLRRTMNHLKLNLYKIQLTQSYKSPTIRNGELSM